MSTTIGSLKVTIDKWCKKHKVDPDCIAVYKRHRAPSTSNCPPGVTYKQIEIKELAHDLETVGLSLWQRSKPLKERTK